MPRTVSFMVCALLACTASYYPDYEVGTASTSSNWDMEVGYLDHLDLVYVGMRRFELPELTWTNLQPVVFETVDLEDGSDCDIAKIVLVDHELPLGLLPDEEHAQRQSLYGALAA